MGFLERNITYHLSSSFTTDCYDNVAEGFRTEAGFTVREIVLICS